MIEKNYSIQEVADQLGVSYFTVYGWIKQGDLPCFHVGKIIRVFETDLEQFIEDNFASQKPARSSYQLDIEYDEDEDRKINVTFKREDGDLWVPIADAFSYLKEDLPAGEAMIQAINNATYIILQKMRIGQDD